MGGSAGADSKRDQLRMRVLVDGAGDPYKDRDNCDVGSGVACADQGIDELGVLGVGSGLLVGTVRVHAILHLNDGNLPGCRLDLAGMHIVFILGACNKEAIWPHATSLLWALGREQPCWYT